MLGEIFPDVLDRTVAPLPAWHPACIPQGDDVNVLLHRLCHWLHLQRALSPVAPFRVCNHTALGPEHYPLGYAPVLVTCLCQPDLPAFAYLAHVVINSCMLSCPRQSIARDAGGTGMPDRARGPGSHPGSLLRNRRSGSCRSPRTVRQGAGLPAGRLRA